MAEFMTGLKRTDYCGELRLSDAGREVTVCGWVQRARDLGQLIFIDLRDRTGIVQLAFNDTTDREVFDKAFSCRGEFVLAAKGVVCERSAKNSDIPTGDIEVVVNDLRILSKAQTPPFEIVDDTNTNEELRLKYRYLDLRRRPLLNNLILRSKIAKTARDYFAENGFIEIETPMMIKSTPEGARDYLVPSRIHNGKFYALPQSPQIYKQLLMLSGFDRYIQLARCFRDEDLRADRQPEFTQIDMELSFVDVDDILEINEGFFKRLFKDVMNIDLPVPFERMSYTDAVNNYGSDKPDIRFDMKIKDISDLVKDCGFGVFTSAINSGGSVRAIVAKNAASVYTRKEIDKLTEYAKGIGAKGLAYVRWVDSPNASFKKFMTDEELSAIYDRLGAGQDLLVSRVKLLAEPGHFLFPAVQHPHDRDQVLHHRLAEFLLKEALPLLLVGDPLLIHVRNGIDHLGDLALLHWLADRVIRILCLDVDRQCSVIKRDEHVVIFGALPDQVQRLHVRDAADAVRSVDDDVSGLPGQFFSSFRCRGCGGKLFERHIDTSL